MSLPYKIFFKIGSRFLSFPYSYYSSIPYNHIIDPITIHSIITKRQLYVLAKNLVVPIFLLLQCVSRIIRIRSSRRSSFVVKMLVTIQRHSRCKFGEAKRKKNWQICFIPFQFVNLLYQSLDADRLNISDRGLSTFIGAVAPPLQPPQWGCRILYDTY